LTERIQVNIVATPIEVILQDRKITHLFINPELTVVAFHGDIKLLQSPSDTIIGARLLDITPELIGSEDVLVDILLGKLPRFELAWVNRDTATEKILYLNLVTLPHTDDQGTIIGLIHIVQEVTDMGFVNQQLAQNRNELRLMQTELSKKNEALATANAELQQLANLKTLFVSIAAHEFRSPLTSILGYIELLLDDTYGVLNDTQRKCLQVVERSADRLKTMTSNLLVATRIETGNIDAFLQPTNLVMLITEIAQEFQPQVNAKSQQLNIQTSPEIPFALCDADLISQVLGNLISNAVKYTQKEGLITITVFKSEDEGFLQISVADNGPGIPEAEQINLFQQFSRLKNAGNTGVEGTGLGLYIAHSLVGLHSGRIWVESEPAKGTIFHLTLPIADYSGKKS
jgi:signal transduction histidine kinase